jgi:hypothetical protein
LLYPPTAVTIAVTTGSRSATITGWQDWMAGCSIVIDGHDCDNQIRNNLATVSLKYPYGGTTGSVGATVYGDCITAESDVLAVYQPIRANGLDLQPIGSAGIETRSTEDFGAHVDFAPVPAVQLRMVSATSRPMAYALETWSEDTTPNVIRLRLTPAPAMAATLEYRAMKTPPAITTITSVDQLPVPFEFVQTIFMPLARQKLTACPFFRTQNGMEEIARAAQQAMILLASLDPSKNRGFQLRPRY